ncbi:MAG TPA: hypothetical protein VN428_22215, partial [Bryobacteraceae bacterium]|nr:hypothetical protein [Bryobacteraceae bacterium]
MQNAECRRQGNGGVVARGLGSFGFWRFGQRAGPGRYAGRAADSGRTGFVLQNGGRAFARLNRLGSRFADEGVCPTAHGLELEEVGEGALAGAA